MSDVPPKGGFGFDLCKRNDMLLKNGVQPPPFTKTGTTIVGLIFKDGVILGADTRATSGSIVCDKNCEKIHYMAPNIFCCGAGTAADTEAVTDMVSSKLQLHRYHTVTKVMSRLHWCSGVLISLALICTRFIHMGQLTLSLMPLWVPAHLLRDEGVQLVTEAICSGIFNDLGSGSNVDICVITKGNKEFLRNHLKPTPRTYVSPKEYSFTKKTEVLLTKIIPLKEKVEVIEVGGDAMEE